MVETWKDVKEYEGLYQVSSIGRVKSLSRLMKKGKCTFVSREKILKQRKHNGYWIIDLRKNGTRKTKSVHQMMAVAFLGHLPCGHKVVVDHIDNNRSNNLLSNLQLITNRENSSKDKKNGMSKYVGVSRFKGNYTSRILINGIRHFLGSFKSEEEANKAYQIKLNEL